MSPEEFVEYLGGLRRRFEDEPLPRPLRACVEPLLQGFAGNFARTEDEDGLQWPKHAPYTIRKHGPHPLLILTGRLYEAVTQEGAAGNILQIEERSLTAGVSGSLESRPGAHQRGDAGPPPIPARQFLYATPATLDQCAAKFREELFTVFFVTA